MTRNIELKTVSKVVSNTSQVNLGGQVPAGMKRWVTFICLDALSKDGSAFLRLYLASGTTALPTKANIIAAANRKMMIDLRASGVKNTRLNHTPDGPPLMIPDRPDANKPLFSIAAENFLGAFVSNTAANVTIQYFDE